MLKPLQELDDALASFVEQAEHFVLLLTTRDEELALVSKAVDKLDGGSPSDVFFLDLSPLDDLDAYVQRLVERVESERLKVNEARTAEGLAPLAEIPAGCHARDVEPEKRLRWLLARMGSWLPPDGDHRLVVALLPAAVIDREGHATLVGALLPQGAYEPWQRGVRIIVREDGAAPMLEAVLRERRLGGAALYTTSLTTPQIADALAEEVADASKPKPARINALLQLAAIDTAVGRLEEALTKYGVAYTYYEEQRQPEMQGTVLFGVGDIFGRVGRFEEARTKYMQALDIASDAKSLPLILQCTLALGEINERTERWAEALRCFEIASAAAWKLMNLFARADALERAGTLRHRLGDPRAAADHWMASASAARQAGYDVRLRSVLERLLDLASRAGRRDEQRAFDEELRAVRARTG